MSAAVRDNFFFEFVRGGGFDELSRHRLVQMTAQVAGFHAGRRQVASHPPLGAPGKEGLRGGWYVELMG